MEKGPPMVNQDSLKHVVIIGGGFGGLASAKALRRAPVRITLIDRRNHHLFQPLLYQVASAALNPADIATPIRSVLRKQKNARVLLADVERIDRSAQIVHFEGGEIAYDFLIVATGATHSYFGNDSWSEYAPGLKTIEDALEIRRRVLLAYEAAERETDPVRQTAWMTFVVIGAGPTGVELAGALAEIATHALAKDFTRIDPRKARVVLVEGLDRVLAGYPEKLSKSAKSQLEKIGVEVMLGARVTGIDERGVDVGEVRIDARTALWAAGVQASPLALTLDCELDRNGRARVDPTLAIPEDPCVFVVGDLAHFEQGGAALPGVAQVAIQGGRHVAKVIRAELRSEQRPAFHYNDKGSMATIGRARAVAHSGRIKLSGFLAWLAWCLIHVLFLVGFRNRLAVMFSWAWNWITFQRGARLITGDLPRLPPTSRGEDEEQEVDPSELIRLERRALSSAEQA